MTIPIFKRLRQGFSLTEMLVVMAVLGMVMALAVPSIEPMLKGNRVTQSADDFRFRLAEFRQKAITENSPIEVRFLRYSDPTLPGSSPLWRAYQFGRYRTSEVLNQSGAFIFEPVSEVFHMPQGIVMSGRAEYSSLTDESKIPQRQHELSVDGVDAVMYSSFVIRPDASTTLGKRSGDVWFLTFMLERDEELAVFPPNFICLCVDAYNSASRFYQR
jgi:uncharacterized protein (TIGR02596 family)